MSAEQAVAELFALCRQQAQADYIGEAVSQLEHMVQAAELARDEGADEELVLAAFCHDVGHFCAPLTTENSMAGLGRRGHERVGANWLLGLGFSQRLAGLVARHVDAKRYLSWREPAYLAGLSEASRQTLHWQGGPMTPLRPKLSRPTRCLPTACVCAAGTRRPRSPGDLQPISAIWSSLRYVFTRLRYLDGKDHTSGINGAWFWPVNWGPRAVGTTKSLSAITCSRTPIGICPLFGPNEP